MARSNNVIPRPITGNHGDIIWQAWVPDSVVVRRDVVLIPKRRNVWRLRVPNNAVAAETREAVVILENDHEHMIKPRDAVLLTLVILILGPRSRHNYEQRENCCESTQIFFH